MRNGLKTLGFLAITLCPQLASAVSSAELYTSESYGYGRVEARVQYAPGDGVVSSAFMWKEGSEQTGVFWNELDFEKLGADCRLETNPIYGLPPGNHSQKHALALDMCGSFHTYTYEWTPEAIVWFVDGMEIRREVGAVPQAFAENASGGMQIHFNLWPGDASFGGNFDPAILPVHEYVDWVQFSKYEGGEFKLAWREDFDGTSVPAGWLTGNWPSPKNKSTHAPENVNFIDGYAVLSLTADDALGPAGAMPGGGGSVPGGSAGAMGTAGATGAAGSSGNVGGSPGTAAGSPGTAAGSPGTAAGGSVGNSAPTDGGCSVHGSSRGGVSALAFAAAALWWGRNRRRRSAFATA
jgi:endo-1,3-1,4-beta-glycanase ExoK